MTPECALVKIKPGQVVSCKSLPNLQEIIDEFVDFKRSPPEEIKDAESMDIFDIKNCKQKYVSV